jgi:hypothetical protein
MAPTASSHSPDVLWSNDRNAATKAVVGIAPGYRDTLVNLLCRDINETASRFRHACSELVPAGFTVARARLTACL